MIENRKNILKYGLSVSSFYLFSWLIHVILISIIAFFHFRLDHQLIVIENWIFDFSWQIYLTSKIISFLIFFKIFIETSMSSVTEQILFPKKKFPSVNIVILCVMNILFIAISGKPKAVDNVLFSYGHTFVHAITVALTFFIDLLVIKVFESENRFKEINSMIKTLIVSLVTFFYMMIVFIHGENLSISLFFILLLNFSYYFLYEKSYVDAMFFCFIVVIPLFTIFGIDPVWMSKYSAVSFSKSNVGLVIVCLSIVSIGYRLFYKNKRSLV